jgi:hypothetical protein
MLPDWPGLTSNRLGTGGVNPAGGAGALEVEVVAAVSSSCAATLRLDDAVRLLRVVAVGAAREERRGGRRSAAAMEDGARGRREEAVLVVGRGQRVEWSRLLGVKSVCFSNTCLACDRAELSAKLFLFILQCEARVLEAEQLIDASMCAVF